MRKNVLSAYSSAKLFLKIKKVFQIYDHKFNVLPRFL